MRLSMKARRSTKVGEIINLMSVDAQKVQDSFNYVMILWEVPILVVFCFYFIYQTIGVSAITGVVVLLLLLPVNGVALANIIRKEQVIQIKNGTLRKALKSFTMR